MDNDKNSVSNFSYKLTNKNVLSCLRNTGHYTVSPQKFKMEVSILSFALVIFLLSFFIYGTRTNLFMTILCLFAIISIHIVPWVIAKKLIIWDKNKITYVNVNLFDKTMNVKIGDKHWESRVLTSENLKEYQDMFVISLENGKLLPLPFELIGKDKLLSIKDILKV